MIETWLSQSASGAGDVTLSQGAVILLGLLCSYLGLLAVYRLWWSPLSQYPGPKLAALTQWVEAYYELMGDGGQFIFKIDQWHEKYDRRTALRHRFGIPLSSHFTCDHHLHRRRRAAMNPMFSKRKAAAFDQSIQAIMDRVCEIIDEQMNRTGDALTLNLNAMWGCVASDVVSKYALGISFGFIETEGFDSMFVRGMANLLEPLHIFTQFPWVGSILTSLPDWLSIKMQPTMEPVLQFKSKVTDQVRALKMAAEQPLEQEKDNLPDTLLSTVLRSDLPPSDLTLERLREEAIGVVAAGVETIYRSLTVGSYYLLADGSIRLPLELELKAAIPDPSRIPSYDVLKQLPYLSACVKEVERIGIGTSQRSARIFRRTSPQCCVQPLVLDQAFSMSIRDVHFDPKLFPSPNEFLPARWLPHDFIPDGCPVERLYQPRAPSGKLLSRYLVPFAYGPRNCVGMHLAEVEIYVELATMFRRYGGRMTLAKGVGPESVGIWMDRFVPRERPGASKVRAIINVESN